MDWRWCTTSESWSCSAMAFSFAVYEVGMGSLWLRVGAGHNICPICNHRTALRPLSSVSHFPQTSPTSHAAPNSRFSYIIFPINLIVSGVHISALRIGGPRIACWAKTRWNEYHWLSAACIFLLQPHVSLVDQMLRGGDHAGIRDDCGLHSMSIMWIKILMGWARHFGNRVILFPCKLSLSSPILEFKRTLIDVS